jgi:predicted RNA-binding protein YlqC (UPF0109 family)
LSNVGGDNAPIRMAHMISESENLQHAASAFLVILKLMVDEPEALRLDVNSGETATVFRVEASPGDVGKLIGSSGRTARSLRIILGAIGKTQNHPITLDIPNPH